MLLQAGQFQQKAGTAVGQIDQSERAVGRLFPMMFFQPQCLFVECDATLQDGDIDIKMVEFTFYFHLFIPDLIIYNLQSACAVI